MHGKAIKFYLPESPCFECESRCAGCHAECEKFKAYRAHIDSFKAKRLEKVKADRDVSSVFVYGYEQTVKTMRLAERRKRGYR